MKRCGILNRIRNSLWLDSVNIGLKCLFHKHSPKYEARRELIHKVRLQNQSKADMKVRQIFIDISSLACQNNATGIHRVVRSIAKYVSKLGSYKGYRLSLVYATKYREGYWHASSYEREALGKTEAPVRDMRIAYKNGDIFLGLDWNMKLAVYQDAFYGKMRETGVRVYFNIYDILPIQLPLIFGQKGKERFEEWLLLVSRYDGILCNTESVSRDYLSWRVNKGLAPIPVGVYRLGADFENSQPSAGLPERYQDILLRMKEHVTFLMVSSLDPRKGYRQTVDAFSILWKRGYDVDLLIVGKELHHHDVAAHIKRCDEFGSHLIWLNSVSDEFLDLLYRNCTCIIFASEGEGYGLAIWEGAGYGKPLILRNLDVFKELAGDNAWYFSGNNPEVLAQSVSDWIYAYKNNNIPSSYGIEIKTWKECTYNMLEILVSMCPIHE